MGQSSSMKDLMFFIWDCPNEQFTLIILSIQIRFSRRFNSSPILTLPQRRRTMYFMALAVDFDGTLAYAGNVSAQTIDALIAIKASGRKLILVTGRMLEELKQIFDRLDLFDFVV